MRVNLQIYLCDDRGVYRNHVVKIQHAYQFTVRAEHLGKINVVFHGVVLGLGRTQGYAILFIITDDYDSKERPCALSNLRRDGKHVAIDMGKVSYVFHIDGV